MNVAPRYLGRGSWLARRDPRVLLVVCVLGIAAAVQVTDVRITAALCLAALAYYASARIPWAAIRGNWRFALTFITLLVVLNVLLTDAAVTGVQGPRHVLFELPLLHTPISAEVLSFAANQFLRYLTMTLLGFPLAFAVAPGDLGTALRRLGLPDKFAFAVDLTMRFIPSVADELRTTMDAQRVRGYEWDAGPRGPVARLRRAAPLMVPLTMNTIVSAEDTIDAMDLRAFGTGRRTWLRALRFDRADWALLGAAALTVVVVTAAHLTGHTGLWPFPFLFGLAE